MRFSFNRRSVAGCLAAAFAPLAIAGSPQDGAPGPAYAWDSVAIGGGGFVAAVVPAPSGMGVAYARTDVGGAYRWDPRTRRWSALLDWVGEDRTGLLGVDALAVDPRDADNLYLLAGTAYLNGGRTAILHSTDGGRHFDVVDVSTQFKTHGNGMGRQEGERLAIDPGASARLYVGTRRDGLFQSIDAGRSWRRVAGLPVTTTPNDVGIDFVLPDPASVKDGQARRVFAGVARSGAAGANLYRSDDAGISFAPIAGAPRDLMPQRAVLDGAGNLLVTYANGAGPHPDRAGREPMDRGQVWKYAIASGAWTEITPAGWTRAFAGIAVDPRNPRRLVVSTINTYLPQGDAKGDRIFLSNDGGASWTDVVAHGFVRDAAGVPWLKGHAIHWAGSVAFDPAPAGAAHALWVTSGNGVFRTADIDATPTVWTFSVAGLEETVPLGLVSLAGQPLVSAIGDYDGFLHADPARYGAIHSPEIGTTTGLDAAARDSATMVRVGDRMLVTHDGGAHWSPTAALMGKRGHVAMAADGAVILHTPARTEATWRSNDGGATWTPVAGLAQPDERPAADPLDARVFYAYEDGAAGGRVLKSVDGGASFAPRAALPGGGSHLIRLAPGRSGDVWVALKDGGLARSTDGGAHFTVLAGVAYCGAVGFGRAAAGQAYPTVFIWGAAGAGRGVYRSLDGGASWARINDDAHQYGGPGDGQFIVGDMNRFGVVYMSTAGRGIAYGVPREASRAHTGGSL